MNGGRVRIVDLAEHADLTDSVARWVHDEWGRRRGRSYRETRQRFIEPAGPTSLPVTRIAMVENELTGVASLRETDSVDYVPGTTPWLCNVFITQAFRGSGVATALCRSLEAAALERGFDRIFLATAVRAGSLYHKLNYRYVSTHSGDCGESYVLVKELSR